LTQRALLFRNVLSDLFTLLRLLLMSSQLFTKGTFTQYMTLFQIKEDFLILYLFSFLFF